jgi:hypothetical protein
MIDNDNEYWELKKAIDLASSADRFAELGMVDLLDLNFIHTCRNLLPTLLKKHLRLLHLVREGQDEIESLDNEICRVGRESIQLIDENLKLKARVEELEERLSIMLENNGVAEGWDA